MLFLDLNSSFYENGPTMSTAFSLSPNVQTQLDVANQIVTEPPVYNSGTNITDPHLQSVSPDSSVAMLQKTITKKH